MHAPVSKMYSCTHASTSQLNAPGRRELNAFGKRAVDENLFRIISLS